MAQDWQAFPSGYSTGIDSIGRTYVDETESIGTPADPPATDVAEPNSAFSLLKGICAELDVPAGSGVGVVNTSSRVFADPVATLGEMDDPAATGSAAQRFSAISLLKGILAQAGI
jgi:hypothetical protein